MKFIELTIHTTIEAEELVSSKLWEYTDYGVTVLSDTDVLELINARRNTWDYLDDSVTKNLGSGVTLIKCYLDLDKAPMQIPQIVSDLNALKENAKDYIPFGTLETITREVEGDDWIEVWRKHYRPIELDNVVICPDWIDYQLKDEQVLVSIDSNMAFGTGEHETTSMCITLMQKLSIKDKVVLDIGTGTGILGITACKLGAKKVVMTDIDPIAVEVAKQNAVINKVEDKCLITLDNLLSKSDSVGDVVIANITADILIMLSKDIRTHLNNGSKLILSGILKERANEVVDTYINLGFKMINSLNKGEWVALLMGKI